jgi:hypothetical protein
LFDAIVMRAEMGAAVLEQLTACAAPVGTIISKPYTDKWAYPIGPGSARAWHVSVGDPTPDMPSWYRAAFDLPRPTDLAQLVAQLRSPDGVRAIA